MCFVGTITPNNTIFVGTDNTYRGYNYYSCGYNTIKLSRFSEKFLCGVEVGATPFVSRGGVCLYTGLLLVF